MTSTTPATRDPLILVADPSRVIGQLFVPGHALAGNPEGRVPNTVAHVLGLSDAEVERTLGELLTRFGTRHRDLGVMFERHARRIVDRVGPEVHISADRRLLLGATFTQEFAVEGAAVCNPSAVVDADQRGLSPGELRIVLSVRQIGEGHRSSIGFRSVVLGERGDVSTVASSRFATAGTIHDVALDARLFADGSDEDDADSVRWVLDGLAPSFSADALTERLRLLEDQRDTRRDALRTAFRMAERASRCYAVRFEASSDLSERVLHPARPMESNGVEDARFVRFVDDDDSVTYLAPYTAYDGANISQQLLSTTDFREFTSFPLLGAGAANKGLALFPRRIAGRYHALCRCDGERNALAVTDDLRLWPSATPLDVAPATWSSVQVGNCGSPIELPEGWLVLTHGVGAMRTYSIGALLLDLDDPSLVIAQTVEPLLRPSADDQDGYVPNVVYSCGALRHGDRLFVPFGIADCRIGFATVSIVGLLGAMSVRTEPPPRSAADARSRRGPVSS
jgi:predicted GH43/DUF377 family glycosyl hydrolase